MNSTLSTTVTSEPARHEHPPHSLPAPVRRRIGLADRAALHLGVALITWSRRPLVVESRERLLRPHELRRAGLERDLAHERMLLLSAPPR